MSDTTGTPGVKARRANVYDRFDRNWQWMGFLASCVAVTTLILWWMVGAIREDVHENILGIIVLGIIGVISGLFSVAFFMMFFDRSQLASPCPVCGHDESRSYKDAFCTECSRCSTYLRAEGMRVFEERPAKVRELPWYRLRIADLATLPLDGLKLPDGCALCEGSVVSRSGVTVFSTESPDSGAGDAVGGVLLATGLSSGYRLDAAGRHVFKGKALPKHSFNADLHRLQFGLCKEDHGREAKYAVVDWEGDLGFRRYGYYREFCRLNGFTKRAAPDAATTKD